MGKEQITTLKDEFEKAAGESGSLTLDQFQQVMSSLKLDHLPVDRIFEMFDTDGNGDLDYKEFLLGISKFNLTGDDALKFCFEVMDEDKSGTLTKEELTKVLVQLYEAKEEEDQEEANEEDSMILEEMPPREKEKEEGEEEEEEEEEDVTNTNTSNTTTQSNSANLHFFADSNNFSTNNIFDGNHSVSIKSPTNGREMDPDMYELLETISTLFEDLDVNNDNVITLEEFVEGCKRHPDVMALFFNAQNAPAPDSLLNTSFRASTGKLLGEK